MLKALPVLSTLFLLLVLASCSKKENNNNKSTPVTATPTELGLYEGDTVQYGSTTAPDTVAYRDLFVAVSQIGTQSVDYGLVFDTGSGGMVIDANGIIPPAMIGTSGFNFAGDSTTVNGITITNQTSTLQYGADSATTTTVYGNLAYAPVTVGDQNGSFVIKRLPFCLYYKAVDAGGNKLPVHYFDTFGVNSEYIYFSPGNNFITSPFSYYDPGTGLTKGFKIAALGTSNFSPIGFTYVPNVVTIGLTSDDVSSSSGYTMHQANFYQGDGYVPIFPTTITYNGTKVSTYVLFDTGTSGYNYIEDPNATADISQLATGSSVTIATQAGFNYAFTVSALQNQSYIENPTKTGGEFTIIGIDFFINNQYLLNFSNNQVGLKNN